jgi:hypothetical protein
MRIFYFVIAFIFIGALSFNTNAQLCGQFGITLNIHDNDLKPVTDHSIKVVPWLKDELKGKTFEPVADKPGTSEIKLLEGHVITGNYKLIVSAPGFFPTEKALTFPHCTRLSYDILLLRKKEKYRVVSGHIGDSEGKSVAYAGVTFTDAEGAERFVSADFLGNYEIKLKPGKYTLKSRSTYYEPYINEKLLVPSDGKLEFHFALRAKLK